MVRGQEAKVSERLTLESFCSAPAQPLLAEAICALELLDTVRDTRRLDAWWTCWCILLYIYILAIVYSLVEHLYILLVGPCLRSWLHKRLSRRGPIFYGQARQKFHRFGFFIIPIISEIIFIDFLSYRFVTYGQVKGRWCNSLAAGGCESAWQRPWPPWHVIFFLELHFLYFPVSNNSI